MDKIVSATVVPADEDDFAGMNEEWLRWFPVNPPARQARSCQSGSPVSKFQAPRSPKRYFNTAMRRPISTSLPLHATPVSKLTRRKARRNFQRARRAYSKWVRRHCVHAAIHQNGNLPTWHFVSGCVVSGLLRLRVRS